MTGGSTGLSLHSTYAAHCNVYATFSTFSCYESPLCIESCSLSVLLGIIILHVLLGIIILHVLLGLSDYASYLLDLHVRPTCAI